MPLLWADRGFRKPGVLRHSRRGSYLELKICEMTAVSRINGQLMAGHLETLKYEKDGMMQKAVMRDGKIRIPLEVCHLRKRQGGELRGGAACDGDLQRGKGPYAGKYCHADVLAVKAADNSLHCFGLCCIVSCSELFLIFILQNEKNPGILVLSEKRVRQTFCFHRKPVIRFLL